MTTDTSEKGLETLIMRHISGVDGLAVTAGSVTEKPEAAGTGYFAGSRKDFDRTHALDAPELDRLSNIVKTFNENFGTLFTDSDRVAKRIRVNIAPPPRSPPTRPTRTPRRTHRTPHAWHTIRRWPR